MSLTKSQANEIADTICRRRPDWNKPQVMGVLGLPQIRDRRAFAETFHAMLAIAFDPMSKQPTRLLEAGPWWSVAAALGEPTNTSALLTHVEFGTACVECLKPIEHLWHGGTGTIHDHAFQHPKDHELADRPKESA